MSKQDLSKFIKNRINQIRDEVGSEKAVIAVSGGVDSTVSAILTHRAIKGNLICIFIDDNFMRLNEPENVRTILTSPPLNLPLKILNERERFMNSLAGISDAEEKRKAFRETFYQTLSDIAWAENCNILVQGTIKADVDETQGGIKTQHNILQQIGIDPKEKFGFKVIEPVASLYKSQVREVARLLSLPEEIVERQPFPGPGLSVRVVGEITPEKLDTLKIATNIMEDSIKEKKPSQYFAAIMSGKTTEAPKILRREASKIIGINQSRLITNYLEERSTGIVDGDRSYGFLAALEIENADNLNYDILEKTRIEIQTNFPEVSRVLWLITKRGEDNGYIIALRAVETRDFLKAKVSKISWNVLKTVAKNIMERCPKVNKIFYDLTPKPPGTIEFE